MNLKKVLSYGLALFIAQVAIGFATGLTNHVGWLVASTAVSIAVCAAIFAHFAAHQAQHPFIHALCALMIQFGLGLLLAQLLSGWVGSMPAMIVMFELITMLVALLIGTSLGVQISRRSRPVAGA